MGNCTTHCGCRPAFNQKAIEEFAEGRHAPDPVGAVRRDANPGA